MITTYGADVLSRRHSIRSFADVHQHHGLPFLRMTALLDAAVTDAAGLEDAHAVDLMRARIAAIETDLTKALEDFGFTSGSLRRLRETLRDPRAAAADLSARINDVRLDMADDAENVFVMTLSAAEHRLFHNELERAVEVGLFFDAAAYDYREAARCLALDRNTAAVFHTVRCLEAFLLEFASQLNVLPKKTQDRSWGRMLKELEAAVAWLKIQGKPVAEFEGFLARLLALKDPLRNATMHLDHSYDAGTAAAAFATLNALLADAPDVLFGRNSMK